MFEQVGTGEVVSTKNTLPDRALCLSPLDKLVYIQ